MKKIVLDTNFIIYCIKYKIDIEKEIDRIITERFTIYVLSGTLEEINNLKLKESKIALEFCKRFKTIESQGHVDHAIKELINEDVIVATNDKELKRQLDKVIIVRKKSYLELI